MKKFCSIFLSFLLLFCVFSFTACGNKKDKDKNESPPNDNNPPAVALTYSDILSSVYGSMTNTLTNYNTDDQTYIDECNNFIYIQLAMLNEISKLKDLPEKKWQYGGLVNTVQNRQANKVEKFYISTIKSGGSYTLQISALFSIKNEDISYYKKSYNLCKVEIKYSNSSNFTYTVSYENSRHPSNSNGNLNINSFNSTSYFMEYSKTPENILLNLTKYTRSDVVGNKYDNDGLNFRATIKNYLNLFCDFESILWAYDGAIVNDSIAPTIFEKVNYFDELLNSIISEELDMHEPTANLSEKLIKYANAKNKNDL